MFRFINSKIRVIQVLFNSKNGVGHVLILGVGACEMGSCLAKEDDHDARAPLVQNRHGNGAPVTTNEPVPEPAPLPTSLTAPLPQLPDSSIGESVVPAPGSADEKLNELQRCFEENSIRIGRIALDKSDWTSDIKKIRSHIQHNNAGQAIQKLQTLARQIYAIRPSPFNLGRYRGLDLLYAYNAFSEIIDKIRQVIEKLGGTMPPEQALSIAPEQALSPAQPLSPPALQPMWPGTDPERSLVVTSDL